MIATIQRFLLAIADFALRRGLLATAPGRALFEITYQAYKSVLEAPAVESLHPFVGPGDWVIDVGANAGFFSRRFARWTTDGGRVVAIEPAPDNIARLNTNLARWRLSGRVDVVAAAATDVDGEATLALDPGNPADHRLSDTGETVRAVTLDRLVADYGEPRIGLVKIDVQGAEPMVLAGAKALIARDKPVLVVEVSEQIESVAGVPRAEMIHALMADGYIARRLTRRGLGPVLDHDGLDRLTAEAWYYDLVLIAPGAAA
jgi:FkbM family methyltransferase